MFRNGLLITTALIVATSLSSAAAHAAACPTRHATPPNFGDANEEFLQNYGFFVSGSSWYSSTYRVVRWTRVAVPIAGRGKTVSKITVKEMAAHTYDNAFYANLYTNSPSGFPGTWIAGGQATAPLQYAPVTVSVRPTTLKRGSTYWIEESASGSFLHSNSAYWEADRKTKRKAYVQDHQWCTSGSGTSKHSSSYTSPWKRQSAGPYVKVR